MAGSLSFLESRSVSALHFFDQVTHLYIIVTQVVVEFCFVFEK